MSKLSTPFSHIRSPVKPKEEIKNPFITDWSHQDNNQVLMKEAPQSTEWPTFTGEGEYGHMSFIKTIEMLQEDYFIPDELFTARLHLVFEKSAKRWYYGIRKTNGNNTWCWWKQEIITKWANHSWRYKSKNAFENSFFDPDKDKPLTWFLKLAEGLNELCPENVTKNEPCSTEEYVNALEDIVTRPKIGRTWKKLDNKSSNKQFIKKDKPREPFNPNTSSSNDQRKCHKCGGVGHLANNCLKKQKSMKLWKQKTTMIKKKNLTLKRKLKNQKLLKPPLSRRPDYPASPRARQALEIHIKELIDLGVLRKVGYNEQVEVTTPLIITWHNGKSRMVEDFRALSTYTISEIYPIPRIHETLTQLSQAKFITAMDALKGFHQNSLTDNGKRLLRIIVHCGILEYLRMPFGIKNVPSHYQVMTNTIFPEELSEG
ncbi:hypothetical protein O181_001339 [Austropuccinia psidii MF-1]|uniref:CCHC-type domain-containing protein n=1 Tax=Austropuccinia psidii MF-1 TaxID=1389203 RepID=A0A9Q3BAB5_9BASI|nr:hypothetical protein [Austropuccinia psidii MF-1]